MAASAPGLHHATAICGHAQGNHDFFTRVLAQRLVKQTVNFDAPEVWHLYYGDATGRPGSLAAFFARPHDSRGRIGTGQASAIAYAVEPGSLPAWTEKLSLLGVDIAGPFERMGQTVMRLRDPDGLPVELVEMPGAAPGAATLHSVTLLLADPAPTARLLTEVFGLAEAGEERLGTTTRLRLMAGTQAVDLIRSDDAQPGRPGLGTIHHIALRAPDTAAQLDISERLRSIGLPVTPIRDRRYFRSVSVREPGGVLVELATDDPGFTLDEPATDLGRNLMLPPEHEPHRPRLQSVLPPLRADNRGPYAD